MIIKTLVQKILEISSSAYFKLVYAFHNLQIYVKLSLGRFEKNSKRIEEYKIY